MGQRRNTGEAAPMARRTTLSGSGAGTHERRQKSSRFMAEGASHGSAGGGGPGRSSGSGAGSEEGGDEELGGRMATGHGEEVQKRLAALFKGVEHAADT